MTENQPTITQEQVRHVAKLSRLSLSDPEVERFTAQLDAILDYIRKLNELDIEGVRPMPHALDQFNIFRADVEQPGMPTDRALANAPDAHPPYFKVPKVLGDGGGA